MCELMQKLAKQEIKEVAKNFLMAGADIDLVVNGTKLSREEVQEIALQLEKKTAQITYFKVTIKTAIHITGQRFFYIQVMTHA